jgi:hypothetical protein
MKTARRRRPTNRFRETTFLFGRKASGFALTQARHATRARHFIKDFLEVSATNRNATPTICQKVIAISTSIKSTNRSLVALSLPKSVPALVSYAENIVKRMTGNASFPNPAPTLAAVTTAIDDLRAAEAAAIARTKGAVSARNDKRKSLVAILQHLRSYIQSVADADEANGPAIIESAGVAVRKRVTRKARVFAAKPGRVSGTATVLAATAAHGAAYEWQYSTDGGKAWLAMPTTLQAKTTLAGLTPQSVVQFRCRTVTRAGEGDWNAPVSLTVQ